MSKILFIHVWKYIEDGKEYLQEQAIQTTLEEAKLQYLEQEQDHWEYQHTLLISYNPTLVVSLVDEIDIRAHLAEDEKKKLGEVDENDEHKLSLPQKGIQTGAKQ